MRSKTLLALPTLLFLTGCAPGLFDRSPAIEVRFVCLRNEEYDQATQDRADVELKTLPPGSAVRQFVGDYGRQREQVRECRKRAADSSKEK